jgi:hypothetical protein
MELKIEIWELMLHAINMKFKPSLYPQPLDNGKVLLKRLTILNTL